MGAKPANPFFGFSVHFILAVKHAACHNRMKPRRRAFPEWAQLHMIPDPPQKLVDNSLFRAFCSC